MEVLLNQNEAFIFYIINVYFYFFFHENNG